MHLLLLTKFFKQIVTHRANVVVFTFLDFSWCRQKHTFWVKEVFAVGAL